jgi:hypothetical protein
MGAIIGPPPADAQLPRSSSSGALDLSNSTCGIGHIPNMARRSGGPYPQTRGNPKAGRRRVAASQQYHGRSSSCFAMARTPRR